MFASLRTGTAKGCAKLVIQRQILLRKPFGYIQLLAMSSNNDGPAPKIPRVDSQPLSAKGGFVRADSVFRNWITKDGSSGFKAEPGRYHLYISLACPWASRTYMLRSLKGLEDAISLTVVHWLPGERGWTFSDTEPPCCLDTINNCTDLVDVYRLANPKYDGRVSVPVLWDKKEKTVVNNESSEIIRMLNTEFNEFCNTPAEAKLDVYPEPLRKEIDSLNDWIYPMINNGVYKCGFAKAQEPYDDAVRELFSALDKVEVLLSQRRYLTGSQLTEADIRLFPTLVRFDQVYHGHFKCNKKTITDYPNIWGYTRELHQMPAIRKTVNMHHIKNHYMQGQPAVNPYKIVSIGPDLDFDEPHGREKLG